MILQVIESAGWPIWLLIFTSIAALSIVIERAWFLREQSVIPRDLVMTVKMMVDKNNIKDFSQFLGRIFINDEEIHANFSKSVLGNPLNALKWYFDQKIKLNKNIKTGEIISLGSITPLIWVNEPCSVKVSIDNLDQLRVNFIN